MISLEGTFLDTPGMYFSTSSQFECCKKFEICNQLWNMNARKVYCLCYNVMLKFKNDVYDVKCELCCLSSILSSTVLCHVNPDVKLQIHRGS
jgi:hypothetical protein